MMAKDLNSVYELAEVHAGLQVLWDKVMFNLIIKLQAKI